MSDHHHEGDELPTLIGGPPALSGRIRVLPEDFRVAEVPAYLPSGSGDHLFVRFEKTDLDTPEAVRRLARALDADPKQAGFAGLKDRHAVTTQWASFLFGDPARLEGAAIDGVRVLEHARHGNKLRTGHLRGNRFDILVRSEERGDVERARAHLAELERRGVPSYFGEQRFGHDNLRAARRWILEGGPPPRDRWKRKLYVSTLQSAIFNELLAERIREGSMDGALDGDLMRKEESGGLFVCEDPALDAARAARFEVSATGPMFGARMRWPERGVRAREEAALARWGVTERHLERVHKSGEGTRRPYRVRVAEVSLEPVPEGTRLAFTLPSGAYATVVLRELARLAG